MVRCNNLMYYRHAHTNNFLALHVLFFRRHIDYDCIGLTVTGFMLLVWLYFSIFWLIYGPLFKADTTCNIIVLMVSNLFATLTFLKIVKNSTQSRVSRDRKKSLPTALSRQYKSALYCTHFEFKQVIYFCQLYKQFKLEAR
jgi:hypothetical protein